MTAETAERGSGERTDPKDIFIAEDGGDHLGEAMGELGEALANLTEEDLAVGLDKSCCGRMSPLRLVYLAAFTASLSSILLGYDIGVMSGAIPFMEDDLNLSAWQSAMAVSSLNLLAAPGALIAGWGADVLGRKGSIALACVIFLLGALPTISATSFRTLLAGRIITGLGVGCGFVVAPVYIAEITPPEIRGKLTALTDFCIQIGILLGYIISFACAETFPNASSKWRAMLVLSMLAPMVILGCLVFLPASPRWLLGKGKDKEAERVLMKISKSEGEAKALMAEIIAAVEIDSRQATWRQLLCGAQLAGTLRLGVGLGIMQQVCGVEAVVYYSPRVLRSAGVRSRPVQLAANIVVGCTKLAGQMTAATLVDQVGRRPLLLLSSCLCTMVIFFTGFTLLWHSTMAATLMGLCVFMFAFSLAEGPLTWVVASEIFPLHARGKGMSATVFCNRLASGVVALLYPLLQQSVTATGTFFIFGILSFGSIFFYNYCVPETKGLSLEEIQVMLEKRHLDSWGNTMSTGASLQGIGVPTDEEDAADNSKRTASSPLHPGVSVRWRGLSSADHRAEAELVASRNTDYV